MAQRVSGPKNLNITNNTKSNTLQTWVGYGSSSKHDNNRWYLNLDIWVPPAKQYLLASQDALQVLSLTHSLT